MDRKHKASRAAPARRRVAKRGTRASTSLSAERITRRIGKRRVWAALDFHSGQLRGFMVMEDARPVCFVRGGRQYQLMIAEQIARANNNSWAGAPSELRVDDLRNRTRLGNYCDDPVYLTQLAFRPLTGSARYIRIPGADFAKFNLGTGAKQGGERTSKFSLAYLRLFADTDYCPPWLREEKKNGFPKAPNIPQRDSKSDERADRKAA